jgi:hypothetical protein
MEDRLSSVEAQLRDIERSLAAFDRRLSILEHERPPTVTAPSAVVEAATMTGSLAREQFTATITFVGRTFIALGGAYLLRALTDSGIVPRRIGIVAGMLYAIIWFVAADRAGGRGRRLSASFHALVATLIAYPLLWEATVRFEDLSPAGGALTLAIVTAVAFGIAIRRDMQPVAWVAVCAALPTALAAISLTGALATFAIYLIGLGLLTLWVGYAWDWVWLRWPVAFVADVTVLALTVAAAGGQPPQRPAVAIAVEMLLLNGYLSSFVVRTIFRARDVIVFEVVQTVATLAIGFGGAVLVAERTGAGTLGLAVINLLFGVGCYIVAFVFMRQGRPRNFHFYSALALVLVITSSSLLSSSSNLAIVVATLAIGATWAGKRLRSVTLTAHGAAYLLIAGIASGLLSAATFALFGAANLAGTSFGAVRLAVLASYVLCCMFSSPMSVAPAYTRVPRAFMIALLVWSGAGAAIAFVTSLLVHATGGPADAGIVATIRTGVLAGCAVLLAWTGQHERLHESAWLLYPVLAAGGIKLLVEDLPVSKPASLFVALAAYGLALIAAPRLSHHRRPSRS